MPPSAAAPTVWTDHRATPDRLIASATEAVGDRYRIESVAGRGGMGRVFRASDARTATPVAIKLLAVPAPHPADDPDASRRGRVSGRPGLVWVAGRG